MRDAETGEPIGTVIHGPQAPRRFLTDPADGREIVAVTYQAQTRVWGLDGTAVAVYGFGGRALIMHAGRLLTVSGDETWHLRDVLTGEAYGDAFPGHGELVTAVVQHGRVLVVSQHAQQGPQAPVRCWDATAGAEVTIPSLWRAEQVTSPGDDDVPPPLLYGLAVAAVDGGLAAAVRWWTSHNSLVGWTELWLPGDDGPRRVAFPGTTWDTKSAVLNDAGRLLTAFGGQNGYLAVRDVSNSTWLASPYFGRPITSFTAVVARVGRTVAVSADDPELRYDLGSGRVVAGGGQPPVDAPGPITTEIHGSGVRVSDTATGRVLMERDAHFDTDVTSAVVAVTAVATGEVDGRTLLATGGDNGTVRVWDVATGEPLGSPWHGNGYDIPVTAVALTRWRDQPVVLSTEKEGPLRMWMIDAAARGVGHTGEVRGRRRPARRPAGLRLRW